MSELKKKTAREGIIKKAIQGKNHANQYEPHDCEMLHG